MEKTSSREEKARKWKLTDWVDRKTLVTLFIVSLLFTGIPWVINNWDLLLGKNNDFMIKVPVEDFGVEPGQVLNPFAFDIIPKDKNAVVRIESASCNIDWPMVPIVKYSDTERANVSDVRVPEEQNQNNEAFRPLFPLPLDSPRRLFCPAVRLPDKPGQYSFRIVVKSDVGEDTYQVNFYVTKPLGELVQ